MKYWLDQLLNRVSMYRLLSIALTSLLILAICLAQLNLLPYSPITMIASAAVLVLSAYGFNVLFGWLFGVKTHDESSYITALILFFLFSPSAQIADLAALALVAMIAMGSKYVLALRGRHIFNPAAVSAVIIGLLGITFATWWVATPILLPATILFAFLILYKTRRVKLGLIFLATAIPLILVAAVNTGQPLLSALAFLPSWPLLFFVGFMLSEPLTLPPRKWQRYLVGVVVAVTFAVPFDLGVFSSTPALALIIGNAIGFLFTQKRHTQLVFKERNQLSGTSEEYIFEVNQPINYIPGQYMEITVPHRHKDGRGLRRIFSIVGVPGDQTIRFGIKMYDKPSSFKRALRSLKPGTAVAATGVGGDFILPKQLDTPLLFFAGGIGITPFISHLLYLQSELKKRDVILIYAVTTVEDLAYIDILKKSDVKVIVVSKSKKSLPVSSWIHHNAHHITGSDLVNYIPDITLRSSYVSGPPHMVDSTKDTLRQLSVRRITCDYFTGY